MSNCPSILDQGIFTTGVVGIACSHVSLAISRDTNRLIRVAAICQVADKLVGKVNDAAFDLMAAVVDMAQVR